MIFRRPRTRNRCSPRFRAIALTFPELARVLTDDEAAELENLETLTPGNIISRTIEDDKFGRGMITFEATGGEG